MFLIKIFLISFTLIISSCSGNKDQDNFDLSQLKIKPKTLNNNNLIIKKTNSKSKIKSNLISLDQKDKIFKSIKYGKKDPFTYSNNTENNFISNLTLKGLISTSNEKYALINYLGQEGTINMDSIGGVNTEFLPNGAKVKSFNFSESEITILFEDKEFIISINEI